MTASHIIPVTSCSSHIAVAYPSEPFQRLAVAYVARQEDLLDLAWDEQLPEFEGKVVRAYGNVQVTNDQNKHCES